jgi:hypothetical protein
MRRVEYLVSILVVVIGQSFECSAVADTFGSGVNKYAIEFVTIGDPGNPPDTTDRPVTDGAVPYRYRIGKYEISEQMIDKANAASVAAGTPLNITHDGRGANMPAMRKKGSELFLTRLIVSAGRAGGWSGPALVA